MKKQTKINTNTEEKAKTDDKKSKWTAILYPESLPEDWVEILKMTGLRCAVSPLHDRDFTAIGEPKKAHFHLILCYPGPTTYSCVCRITHEKLCGSIPQAIEDVRGLYRYFTHKDDANKAQYDENDIKVFNGFNINDFVELTKSEVDEIKNRIVRFIREKSITEYADLIDIFQDENMKSEFIVAASNTIFFTKYIASRRHSKLTPGGKMLADFREKNNENE